MESTIRTDQKAFLQQTGMKPQDITVPGTSIGAEAMMSPSAGAFRYPVGFACTSVTKIPNRYLEASNCDG